MTLPRSPPSIGYHLKGSGGCHFVVPGLPTAPHTEGLRARAMQGVVSRLETGRWQWRAESRKTLWRLEGDAFSWARVFLLNWTAWSQTIKLSQDDLHSTVSILVLAPCLRQWLNNLSQQILSLDISGHFPTYIVMECLMSCTEFVWRVL